MAYIGLVASNNFSDIPDKEKAWDNLGNGISYTINNVTTSGVVIKGADILALVNVSALKTQDFLYLRGLTSNVQSRLTTIAGQVASGIALQNNALLKDGPVSSGNYSLTGNLSFQSLLINQNGVQSLTTSPFSGNTATTSIHFGRLKISSGLTIQNVITSGVVNSPEIAIPVEDGDFLYYIKAGQS